MLGRPLTKVEEDLASALCRSQDREAKLQERLALLRTRNKALAAERDRLRTFVERLTAGVCTCQYMRMFTPVLTRIGVKCQHCEATAVLAEAKP
jgi:hypothetical protein